MPLQNAAPAAFIFARYLNRPHCPQCGQLQFAPVRSDFAGEELILHAWLCDDCGTEFRTRLEFRSAAA